MKLDIKKIGRLAFFDSAEVGRTPPDDILLLKFGRNKLTKGGERVEFDFTEADADMIMSDFAERGKDLVIDYEHQTLKGVEAPAAGWIDRIYKTSDGIHGHVKEWTNKAQNYLKELEYRFMSPVADFTRRKASLHSIALTNHPALHGYPAIVADDMGCGEMNVEDQIPTDKMEKIMQHLKAIASALGSSIPDDADEAKAIELVTSGINTLKSKLAETETKITGMVSMTDLENAKKELAEVKARSAVDAALATGKIGAKQVDKAVRLAMSDMDLFNEFIAAAEEPKAAAPTGKVDASVSAPDPKAALIAMSDDELKVYKTMGLTDSQIETIKTKKQEKK